MNITSTITSTHYFNIRISHQNQFDNKYKMRTAVLNSNFSEIFFKRFMAGQYSCREFI